MNSFFLKSMSFITGITDVSCRFSLSRKKDGPLQKTSRKLTVVVTMATVTNSLISTPFFLPKDLPSKKALFQNHLKMWMYTLLCVIYWALSQHQTIARSLQAVQHLLKEHKHDYTVLIVVSVISVSVLLLMSYDIVSFCVKNHCRIRQYSHIYYLRTSELFDL